MALYGLLSRAGLLEGREPKEARVLLSLPGCKRQGMHWDWDPDKVRALGENPKPIGVLVCLEPGSCLWVWDKAEERKVCVRMSPGDVLVFEGDVQHSGAGYVHRNLRLHLHMEVPGLKRVPGGVWSLK